MSQARKLFLFFLKSSFFNVIHFPFYTLQGMQKNTKYEFNEEALIRFLNKIKDITRKKSHENGNV